MKHVGILPALFLACTSLTGCLVVGYSTRTGFFFWPGSLIITIVVVALWLLFRSR
ncbi:MAG TPA: hypothetical protein VIM67_05995 [Terriglobus sp.]